MKRMHYSFKNPEKNFDMKYRINKFYILDNALSELNSRLSFHSENSFAVQIRIL